MLITAGDNRLCEAAYRDQLIHNKDQHKLVLVEGDCAMILHGRAAHIPEHSLLCLSPEDNPSVIGAPRLQVVYFSLRFWCRSLTADMLDNDIKGLPQPVMTDDLGGVLRKLNPFHRRDMHPDGVISLPLAVYSQVSQCVAIIRQQLQDRPDGYWSCRARSYLSRIMDLIIDLDVGADFPTAPLAHRASTYIHAHLSDAITLSDIASHLHQSKGELNHAFRAIYGTSVYQYVIDCRMKRAQHDLAMTSLPIEEIAHSVGYDSPSHFTDVFVRRYGMTPTRYRYICAYDRKALFGSSAQSVQQEVHHAKTQKETRREIFAASVPRSWA